MEKRRIGSLDVSAVGLGTNQFGTKCDANESRTIVLNALDAEITFIDTADEYGNGLAEEHIGRAIVGRRDEVVIATKAGYPLEGQPDSGGASARWIEAAVEGSLRRLGTDHIDLFQQHLPDEQTPLEQTLAAMDRLVTSGKVREIGCCNFTGSLLRDAASIATGDNLSSYQSTQNCLNLLQRATLDDVVPAALELGIAFIPYWPLASGVLTDKYRRGQKPLPGTRLADQVTNAARSRILSERTFARLDVLREFAESRGHSLLELAFAWLLALPCTSSVIAGATSPHQVRSNAAAGQWRLSAEDAVAVTELVATAVRSPA